MVRLVFVVGLSQLSFQPLDFLPGFLQCRGPFLEFLVHLSEASLILFLNGTEARLQLRARLAEVNPRRAGGEENQNKGGGAQEKREGRSTPDPQEYIP